MTGPIAVTGAAGYVGGRLVGHLRAVGHDVLPLVRHPVSWVEGAVPADLAEVAVDDLCGLLAGCRAVVHLAGASEVRFAADPDGAMASTLAATRRTALAAAAAGVERIVMLSTVHVYGAALERGGVVDEDTMPSPRHPYAVARLAGEHLAAAAGPELVVLRLTNSVGAPADRRVDRWTLVATELCARAAAGDGLVLRSSGHQWRDFVDLGEACRAIAVAATGGVPPGTYNLGSGQPVRVLDLAHRIAEVAAEVLGWRPPIEAPAHSGEDPPRVVVDVSRLGQHTGPPAVSLEASVEELIRCCAAGTDGTPTPEEVGHRW